MKKYINIIAKAIKNADFIYIRKDNIYQLMESYWPSVVKPYDDKPMDEFAKY